MSLVVGGVFNSGILAAGTRGARRNFYDYRPAGPDIVATVRRLEDVCDSHGVALPAAAIQFPLAHPAVAAVIPGVASAAEVDAAIHHMRARIPAAFWSDLKSTGLLDPLAPVPTHAGAAP